MRRACEAWNRTRSVAVVAPDGATAADGDQGGEAEIRTRFLGILDRESGIMGRASYESSQAEESWAWARRERSAHVTPGSLKTRSRGPCLVWSRHLPQNLYGPLGRKPLHHTVSPCSGSRSSRSAACCRRRPPRRPLAGLRRSPRRLFPAEDQSCCPEAVAPEYIPDPLLDLAVLGSIHPRRTPV